MTALSRDHIFGRESLPDLPHLYKSHSAASQVPFPPKMSDSKHLISLQDVNLITKAAIGPEYHIIDYSIQNWSSEKLGFLGSHRRLKVTLKNDRSKRQFLSCFVKALPQDSPLQLLYVQESRTFHKEAVFFSKIFPLMTIGSTIPSWCPRCFLVKDSALVFEDLTPQGFRNRNKLFTEELIKSALRTLAHLHASSILAEKHMGKSFQEMFPEDLHDVAFVRTKMRRKWFLAGVQVVLKVAEEMGLDTCRLSQMFEEMPKAMKSSADKTNVISHGDLWGNNLLFDESSPPECKLVDFQLVRYCPLGHDLAQLLYLCASRDMRDAQREDFLKFYHQELVELLREGGTRAPTLQEVIQGYEEQKIAACCTAALFFPTVLLDGDLGAEIMDNPETYGEYYFEDRRDVVLGVMETDPVYGRRIRETVRELVEMAGNRDGIPQPT